MVLFRVPPLGPCRTRARNDAALSFIKEADGPSSSRSPLSKLSNGVSATDFDTAFSGPKIDT